MSRTAATRCKPFKRWALRACLCLAIVLCAMPRASWAQSCVFSTSNIVFGNMSTITGSPVDANGTLSANCTGFSTSMVRLCLSLGAPAGSTFQQRYLVGPSNAKLTTNIYADAAHQTIWGSYYASASLPPVIVDLPIVAGSASTNVTMYGRVDANQIAAPVGAYSVSFAVGDTMFVYLGYSGTPPSCTVMTPKGTGSFTMTATVVADCNITAAPLTFPATGFLNNPLQSTSAVQVTCVSGAPYTVSLDAGTTPGGTLAQRKMLSANGASSVNYQLYKDAARTLPWGDGSAGTATNTGTGNGSTQSFTVYGKVPPQTSQPPGSYTDIITATISF